MQPPDSTDNQDTDSAIRERLSGALAGRYRVERVLGRGGMAHVFLAHDLRHDRPVALKVLRPELTAALGPERFLREIALTTRLSHPRIVAIYDSGNADPYSWYVMPYIAGESLRDRLHREPQLSVEDAVAVTAAVAAALSYAHERGIIHRDIKPENVLFAGGEPIVTDFGIGRAIDVAAGDRLTDTGLAVGTAEYMSPEQAAADPRLDGRSDEFALGCLTYEMLVGEPPFRGPTMQAVAARRALEPMPSICAVRRGVSPAVENVIRKALEKAPADRYPTTDAFARALAAAASGGGTAELPRATIRRPRRLAWAAAATALILLIAGTAYVVRRWSRPPPAPAPPSAPSHPGPGWRRSSSGGAG
jgi:serine/threonine-protein kinase